MNADPHTHPPVVDYLASLRREVEAALERLLGSLDAPRIIHDAMAYSLMAGGKRLRPCLTLAAAEAAGATRDLSSATSRLRALPAAVALEMIHTYSLIHDDLPAMDDDALRRGRPTSHVIYGDGLAILAGDGLLTEAFAVLAGALEVTDRGSDQSDAALQVRAVGLIARAAGAAGMVGGQAIDLSGAGRVPGRAASFDRIEALEDMHARKTGALIRASVEAGAVLAGADDEVVRAIGEYGRQVGLAFQIIDDVLDVEGSNEALGKTAGKDARSGKPTYPAFYGVERSRALAAQCVDRARQALSGAGIAGRLPDIAAWSLTRRT